MLSALLSHPSITLKTLHQGLKTYDDVRRPFSQEVQGFSDQTGALYHLEKAGWEGISAEDSMAGRYPAGMVAELGETLKKKLSWVYDGEVTKGRDQAVGLLESALAA